MGKCDGRETLSFFGKREFNDKLNWSRRVGCHVTRNRFIIAQPNYVFLFRVATQVPPHESDRQKRPLSIVDIPSVYIWKSFSVFSNPLHERLSSIYNLTFSFLLLPIRERNQVSKASSSSKCRTRPATASVLICFLWSPRNTSRKVIKENEYELHKGNTMRFYFIK